MKMIDYEQLYYDEKYKNKTLLIKLKNLEDEISILKGKKTLIEYIIEKVNNEKNYMSKNKKECNKYSNNNQK